MVFVSYKLTTMTNNKLHIQSRFLSLAIKYSRILKQLEYVVGSVQNCFDAAMHDYINKGTILLFIEVISLCNYCCNSAIKKKKIAILRL